MGVLGEGVSDSSRVRGIGGCVGILAIVLFPSLWLVVSLWDFCWGWTSGFEGLRGWVRTSDGRGGGGNVGLGLVLGVHVGNGIEG